MGKCEGMSPDNKLIVKEYMGSLLTTTPKLSNSTLAYNMRIVKFMLENTSSDLNQLANHDINSLKVAISTWTRKSNWRGGGDVSDVTKKQYIIGFKRFLTGMLRNMKMNGI